MIDYKISHIIRYDDITEVKVRVYLGDITTEDEYDIIGHEMKPVTRYRRSKLLKEIEIKYRGNIAPSREERDDYLRRMLNKKLSIIASNVGQQVIDQQKELLSYYPITILNETTRNL